MKKDLFFEYAKWIFDILKECEKEIEYYENPVSNRAIAHISERLTGIYLTYLKSTNKIKIKECQRTLILNTDIPKTDNMDSYLSDRLNSLNLSLAEKIFSIKNCKTKIGKYKVITALGRKIKFRK